MAISANLELTVDLPQDATDVPAQMSADNENFKKIDEWAGKVALKATSEYFTISSWTEVENKAPYKYSATVTATTPIEDDTQVELVNSDAIVFATYGFAIAGISGQDITIYSIAQPTSEINLRIDIGG